MREKYYRIIQKVSCWGNDAKRHLWLAMQNLKSHASSGLGVIEVILILVVVIGLILIFKSQLTTLINSIFEKITSESSGI